MDVRGNLIHTMGAMSPAEPTQSDKTSFARTTTVSFGGGKGFAAAEEQQFLETSNGGNSSVAPADAKPWGVMGEHEQVGSSPDK